MFDRLIDSSPERPRRRFLGFFFGTSIIYLLAITAALVGSVLITNPELAHTSNLQATRLAPLPKGEKPDTPPATERSPQRQAQPNIYNPEPPEQTFRQVEADQPTNSSNNPPTITRVEGPGIGTGEEGGDPDSQGFISGMGSERRGLRDTTAPPPPPPPVAATRQPERDDRSPVRVPSTVLQGKAVDRRTPAYPRMAMIAHVEGPVSVEVVISPDGRVEVARAVSGHPLLKPAAAEAARSWRFQPTMLNGTPVRATGIITFVFKLD
jgi:protein TonB